MSGEVKGSGDPRQKILSLCGGGYLGLYSAELLAYLEEHLISKDAKEGRLHEVFRLIAGTSAGGLIALAVAFKVPAHRIASEFRIGGKLVFPEWWFLPRWLRMVRLACGAMYKPDAFIKVFADMIGPNKTLSEVSVPVCITALDLTRGKPHVFVGRPGGEGSDIKVLDVLRATTAAPLYFPAVAVRNQRQSVTMYADGGLFANAPDVVALKVATESLLLQRNRVHLVSIGTTMIPPELPELGTPRPWSSLRDWIKEFRLIQYTMSAQMATARELAGTALADPTHTRQHRILDIDQPRDWQEFLRLDRADDAADERIKWLVDKTIEDKNLRQFRDDWIILD